MARILTYTASREDAGRTVSDVIRREFRLVAHDIARAKYRTEQGITVDGVQVMVNRRLLPGEMLRVILDNELPGKTVPVRGDFSILYEDEDVLAVNKPAGLVVHPSHGHFADTLANYVADYYLRCDDPHEVRTIGRLDKDTSGVILFGKSRTACAHLVEQAENGLREKVYLALAEGVFENHEGSVCAPISREYEEKIRRVVREDGDYALTHYSVMHQFHDFALLELTIETGRTHQIRVHMAHLGHPLLGDPIYGHGEENPYGIRRAALHAWKLRFSKPFSDETVRLEADLPDDFREILQGYASEFTDLPRI